MLLPNTFEPLTDSKAHSIQSDTGGDILTSSSSPSHSDSFRRYRSSDSVRPSIFTDVGDDGYASLARSLGFSPPLITIESVKIGNGGVRPRGGGSYNHNYGGKPDQGRGNQEWNQHRNYNRNINMNSQRGVGSGMNYFQVIAPPTVGGPSYFPGPDPLHDKIVNQINYYFSNDNLVKDTYLRRHMDEQGWIPVNLIARFNKVSNPTYNVQLILDVMHNSIVVEVHVSVIII
ncbi:hypothetical protein QVD17_09305 [Tagetes erecta]|uniref:HTH La-type RNA-binding domain-containing protein n=1 Tax=Tagetes erecta TaxID=13708 RepID=A0AAD8P4Y5_TARER|nr:hypothetical protein QVD17_09305 [Tagetes erecta]